MSDVRFCINPRDGLDPVVIKKLFKKITSYITD